jgi:hypothetical protein
MDHDDDVEHLFSWLQTPDLRYREFAGAREVTDTVATSQILRNLSNGSIVPAAEVEPEPEPSVEAAAREMSAASAQPSTAREAVARPSPMQRPLGAPGDAVPVAERGVFALGAGGRAAASQPASVAPVFASQAALHVAPAKPAPVRATAPVRSPVAEPPAPARGGRLLGGAYRENGAGDAGSAQDRQTRDGRSLDAVFSRLANRRPAPDPRDRVRHIPGFGPPAARSR